MFKGPSETNKTLDWFSGKKNYTYEYQRDKVVTSPKISDFSTLKRVSFGNIPARPLKPILGRSYDFLLYFLLLGSTQLPFFAPGGRFE